MIGLVTLAVAAGALPPVVPVVVPEWPAVAPRAATLSFPDIRTERRVVLRGPGGEARYVLTCGAADTEVASGASTVQCTLAAHDPPFGAIRDLLHEDLLLEKGWDGRARFTPDALRGACARDPAWGATRSFRLRGLELTLAVTPRVPDAAGATGAEALFPRGGFTLRVAVRPDPSATTAIAEPPPFAAPSGAACEAPRPAHVPGRVTPDYLASLGLPPGFPAVKAQEHVLDLGPDPSPRSVTIAGAEGRAAYRFSCEKPPGGGVPWFGMRCRLVPAGGGADLLADAVDRWTHMPRAVLRPDQLFRRCAAYPEWGATRTFRLRGLRLTLRVTGIEREDEDVRPAVRRARLHVEVAPDPAATDPVALPIEVPYWELQGSAEEVCADR